MGIYYCDKNIRKIENFLRSMVGRSEILFYLAQYLFFFFNILHSLGISSAKNH